MQAYKCDLCTAFFTKQSNLVVNKSDCFVKVSEGRKIDLCPSCTEAIQKVINKCSEMGVTRDGTKNS